MPNDRAKLTKRLIDNAEPADKRYVINDTALAGFRLVVAPSGRKTFALRYRVGGGRAGTIREPNIGQYGVLTLDQARKVAAEWLAEAANGKDPSARKNAERNAPKMDELFDRYMVEHARPHKKDASVQMDETFLRLYLRPAFGSRKVAEVNRADVTKFHVSLSEKPTTANRCIALLSKVFSLAEEWGLRPTASNPCFRLKKFAETERMRFLSPDELARLGKALSRAERGELGAILPQAVAAIRLLLFTGARRNEILSLRWEWIDIEAGRASLPDSKTGFRPLMLPAPALDLIAALPRVEGNPFVIPGGKPGSHLVNLKDPWQKVRAAANLDDVHIHDLRHSFAAVGAGSGQSLHMIGSLLGHTQAATTRRYAHLADDPQKAASDEIASQIAAALDGDAV